MLKNIFLSKTLKFIKATYGEQIFFHVSKWSMWGLSNAAPMVAMAPLRVFPATNLKKITIDLKKYFVLKSLCLHDFLLHAILSFCLFSLQNIFKKPFLGKCNSKFTLKFVLFSVVLFFWGEWSGATYIIQDLWLPLSDIFRSVNVSVWCLGPVH